MPPTSATLVAHLPQVSKIMAVNLPQVPLVLLVANFTDTGSKIASGKFASSVNDTSGK
jgi:hypothetical protein